MRKLVCVALAALAMLFAACGTARQVASPARQSANEEASLAFDPPATAEDEAFRVTVYNLVASTDFDPASTVSNPDPGMIQVAIDVQLESKLDTNLPLFAFYFTLLDTDNFAYTNGTRLGVKEPVFQSRNSARAGDKMRGWITFQIPREQLIKVSGIRFESPGGADVRVTFRK